MSGNQYLEEMNARLNHLHDLTDYLCKLRTLAEVVVNQDGMSADYIVGQLHGADFNTIVIEVAAYAEAQVSFDSADIQGQIEDAERRAEQDKKSNQEYAQKRVEKTFAEGVEAGIIWGRDGLKPENTPAKYNRSDLTPLINKYQPTKEEVTDGKDKSAPEASESKDGYTLR